jgi:NAD(P)-dependent dehydrogenase (short-subunit alcohol dehydrogenase family)
LKTEKVNTALVIGGGSGMGSTSAVGLSRLGIRVFVADIELKDAENTANAIRNEGGDAEALQVDISRSQSVGDLFKRVRAGIERLDLMIQTAGILGRTVFIEDMKDDEWQQMISVNLDGTFYCCRETIRWMKEHGTGRIILFSSVASLIPTPGALHYSTAKGGVNMMAKTLAAEVAKYNIRVNVIAPGYIKTPMLEGLPERFEKYVVKKTPVNRLGEKEEIAGLVCFLASEDADFFTGQIISPNGGLVI